jgi:hypothetical protein
MSDPLRIRTDLLRAVAQWSLASPGDRLHLAVVAVLDGELVATDGHRLARVPVGTHKNAKFALKREHIFAAAAAQHKLRDGVLTDEDGKRVIEIRPDGKTIMLDLGPFGMVVPAGRIEDYPPFDRAMPKGPGKSPPAGCVVNPRYLAAIADIQDVVQGDERHGIRLTMWGDPDKNGNVHEPMLFEGYGGTRYVIMPMRDSFKD